MKKINGFYKIMKSPYEFENLSLWTGFKAIGSYYSITPKIYQELNQDLCNEQYQCVSFGMKEFDYRTRIGSLLGIKYYILNDDNSVPYGYKEISEYNGESKIYQNNNAIPFGVLYTKYIDEKQYENLNPLEKEVSLLKQVAISEEEMPKDSKGETLELNNIVKEVNYEIDDTIDNILHENIIAITNPEESIRLKIEDIENSELYLVIDKLDYKGYDDNGGIFTKLKEKMKEENKWFQYNYSYTITANYSKISKSILTRNKFRDPYYMKHDKMVFNLGYYDKASDEIEIQLTRLGLYQYDKMKVYAVSMEGYEEDINNLKKSNFEVLDYSNGYLKGKVNAEESGILQFSTMYSKGWKVYVDDKEAKAIKSNKYFLGTQIEKGEHEIRLEYKTPYLMLSILITIFAIIIFTGLIIYKATRSNKINS